MYRFSLPPSLPFIHHFLEFHHIDLYVNKSTDFSPLEDPLPAPFHPQYHMHSPTTPSNLLEQKKSIDSVNNARKTREEWEISSSSVRFGPFLCRCSLRMRYRRWGLSFGSADIRISTYSPQLCYSLPPTILSLPIPHIRVALAPSHPAKFSTQKERYAI